MPNRGKNAGEKRKASQLNLWVSLFALTARELRAKYMAWNWHCAQNFQRELFLFLRWLPGPYVPTLACLSIFAFNLSHFAFYKRSCPVVINPLWNKMGVGRSGYGFGLAILPLKLMITWLGSLPALRCKDALSL